ncbi:MAG TPA: hypothetical protein VE135_07630 [Pyrinomonadaceae bacterium]|nr:hypothetical protein [Pyrinomonadaceae bacterium]
MKKAALSTVLIVFFFTGAAFLTAESDLSAFQGNGVKQMTNIADNELMALVKTFSEDLGENGQEAWRKLGSYPRSDLIHTLLRVRKMRNTAPSIQSSIAFVLCNMDYEYQKNVQIIVSGLPTGLKDQNYADQSAVLLGRLIDRGDTNLLRILFNAVPWSDASLATALGDVFSRQLRDRAEMFLTQLKAVERFPRGK